MLVDLIKKEYFFKFVKHFLNYLDHQKKISQTMFLLLENICFGIE